MKMLRQTYHVHNLQVRPVNPDKHDSKHMQKTNIATQAPKVDVTIEQIRGTLTALRSKMKTETKA